MILSTGDSKFGPVPIPKKEQENADNEISNKKIQTFIIFVFFLSGKSWEISNCIMSEF